MPLNLPTSTKIEASTFCFGGLGLHKYSRSEKGLVNFRLVSRRTEYTDDTLGRNSGNYLKTSHFRGESMGFLRIKSLHRIAVIVFLCAFALGTNMAFADEQPLLVEETLSAQDTQTRTESGIQPDSPITQPEHMNAQAAPTDSTSTNNSESIPLSTFARDNEVQDEAQAEPSNERALTAMEATETKTINMYRLYNPNSGEHFYTGSTAERVNLVDLGWKYEGIGWIAPAMSSSPVYRLYNPNAGDHHYTLSSYERYELVRLGWNDEGIGWYSDDSQRVPLLRQYNPNAKAGAHNFTTSSGENDMLVEAGWKAEGIGWYAVSSVNPAVAQSRIYLDAGNGIGSSTKGVYDSGACGSGYEEAKLTAELVTLTAKYARELYGLDVYSNVDSNVEYWNRQADAKARGCTSLVSIHFNASSGGGTGSESYIHSRNAAARADELQSIMHRYLVKGVGLRDRGMKSAALAVCSGANTGLPGTLLEICFIDNSYDMKQFQAKKDALARELAAGLFEAAQAGF